MISHDQTAETLSAVLSDPAVDAVLILPIRRDGQPGTALQVLAAGIDPKKADPDRTIRTMQALAAATAEHADAVAKIGEVTSQFLGELANLPKGQ